MTNLAIDCGELDSGKAIVKYFRAAPVKDAIAAYLWRSTARRGDENRLLGRYPGLLQKRSATA